MTSSHDEMVAREKELFRAAWESVEGSSIADLARGSLVASVADEPEMMALVEELRAPAQSQLDIHLTGETVRDHETVAKALGQLMSRASESVNALAKSINPRIRRLGDRLLVSAPAPGSVRVVMRAPDPDATQSEMVAGVSAESVALDMLVTLMEQAEVDDLENSALTATVQSINPQARNRVRLLADTIAKSHWTVEGTLARRGASPRMITMTHRGAAHLAEELGRTETVPSSRRTYFGTIDGQIRSESMMQFIPEDGRRFKATVPSANLMNEVARLAGTEGLRVSATFEVFEEIPAGQASYVRRSYALQSIRGAPREHQPPLQ